MDENPNKTSPTISETEIDMQKIQMKIMALEQNLQRFSARKILPVHLIETKTTSEVFTPSSNENKVTTKRVEETEMDDTSNEEKVSNYIM